MKIDTNIARDKKKREALELLGWKVLVVWECELKPKKKEARYKKLIEEIGG